MDSSFLPIEKARQIFSGLDEGEREMLLILAFNRFAVPSYKISSISEEIGRKRGGGTRVPRNQAPEKGKRLLKLKLVSQKSGQWFIKEHAAWPMLKAAFIDQEGYINQDEVELYEAGINNAIPYSYWDFGRLGKDLMMRQFQFAILLGEEKTLIESFGQLNRHQPDQKTAGDWVRAFLGHPLDESLLNQHTGGARLVLLLEMYYNAIIGLFPAQDLIKPLEELTRSKYKESIRRQALEVLTELGILTGDVELMERLAPTLEQEAQGLSALSLASLIFWRGDHKQALTQYNAASRQLKARGYFSNLHGIFHDLLLLFERDFKKVKSYEGKESIIPYAVRIIQGVALFQGNQFDQAKFMVAAPQTNRGFLRYVFALAQYWCDMEPTANDLVAIEELFTQVIKNGYGPAAMDLAAVLAEYAEDDSDEKEWKKKSDYWKKKTGYQPLLYRQPRFELWERALEGLISLGEGDTGSTQIQGTRLVWRVNFDHDQIQPIEQKITKSGKWSKGRNVALKRLKEEGVTGMTAQDERIVRHVEVYSSGWYGNTDYSINFEKAIVEMVDHPLLFLEENPQLSVELVGVEPELVVEQHRKGGFTVSLIPEVDEPGITLIKETSTRYQLLKVSDQQWRLAQYLGGDNLRVPNKGKEQLIQAIGKVSSVMRVQSDVVGGEGSMKDIPSTAIPRLLLVPMGDEFKIEVFAKPFGNEPPFLKPGQGRESLIAEINGERVRTQRDLKQEKANAQHVIDLCPTLQQHVSYEWEWYLEEAENCLNLLLELEPLRKEEKVVIEWPKGEKLKLAGTVDFGQLSLKVKGNQDWFSVEGQLHVDEDHVIELRSLLALLDTDKKSQFVQLNDGRFLALTEQLKKHLSELNAFAQERKGQLGLHPLMSDSLAEFSELGAELKANAAWRKRQKQLAEARKFQPDVPRNLQADLRSYQEEGYNWLARLAHWGVGACLADDMGLGKTLQALALLLSRASLGPSLVVAPASVVRNWYREAERFTPDLHPIILSETNRDEAISSLQSYDLLLVSYTLLQIESEKLDTVEFSNIVLDEAQAIKNRQTKRSKAAKSLQGSFRLITTGTPIENHLGELWNLFDFINPGLLGSLDHFNERFANPIEKYQDKERRYQLRKLLRPFILRRRKSEVLSELPEKTEVSLTVTLSPEEVAFYEALRREAVDKLSSMDVSNPGEQRIRILAEITRLRQAACHPSLVKPEVGLSSSKLELFGEVVTELRENGHKALVFSQFVKYLRLVEEWVQKEGIPYQYLDGQTPLKKREERVQAFQRGQGDLFLISLKAGGVGLNLTAADYVIHLDPWWNPAVEDQASDRAHRIGQQRPVTVYRLVAENTIEEKILKLHGEKRDLADSLLEGTDRGAKLSSTELLDLIREG